MGKYKKIQVTYCAWVLSKLRFTEQKSNAIQLSYKFDMTQVMAYQFKVCLVDGLEKLQTFTKLYDLRQSYMYMFQNITSEFQGPQKDELI